MNTARHILAALLPLLASCGGDPIQVEDGSFEVAATVESTGSDVRTLYVTLLKGDQDSEYSLGYTVDGGYSVSLADASGAAVDNICTLSFRKSRTLSFTFPELPAGDHSVALDVSCGRRSQHLECAFTVELERFSVHVEVNTSSSKGSCLLLSLIEGRSDVPYTVSVTQGGETVVSGRTVDFGELPIAAIPLPVNRPGASAPPCPCPTESMSRRPSSATPSR